MAMAAFIISALAVLVYLVYHIVSSAHSYWAKKGVKGPKPHPIYGNVKAVLRTQEYSMMTFSHKLYKEYPEEKAVGMYLALTPTLLVRDPKLIKTILIKDFHSFTDRGIRVGNDPITKNLFAADGDDWKTLRQKLTPIFTTGKLRGMMPLVNSCVDDFMEHLETSVVDEKGPKEVRGLMMKYTMKTITSVAFGLDVNTFAEEPTEFEAMAKKIFKPGISQKLIFILNNFSPELVNYLHLKTTATDVLNFFMKLVKEIVREREGKPKIRKDFMDLIIELREQGHVTRTKDGGVVELDITDELITAQAFVFYAAGFETSSGTMSFLLYELAKNPAIQDRCYEEIDRVMKNCKGKPDYDSLNDLKYTAMALDEAMRIHPVVGVLFRQCVQDYTFQSMNLTINKGTKLLLPTLSLHMDPNYFPEPEKFDPDRFLPENKETIHDYYIPFGDGPRNCIGLRFARVQVLLGIAHFLHKYRVSPCEKTPQKISYDPQQITLVAKDGIWLNIERRNRV